MKRVKGDILGFRQVELAERHRNCLPRGGVTFREFYGSGPAEGAGQAAELHVELLHRSFHHRYVIHRDQMKCSRVSQLYSPLGGSGWSWSMGADQKKTLCLTHTDLWTHIFLLHSQPWPQPWLTQLLPVVMALSILGVVVNIPHLLKFLEETL